MSTELRTQRTSERSAAALENGMSEHIRLKINKQMMKDLGRRSKAAGLSKAALCRIVWDKAHTDLKEYLREIESVDIEEERERPIAKNWVILVVAATPEMKKELMADAEKIKCSLSEYLREVLGAFLEEMRVKE